MKRSLWLIFAALTLIAAGVLLQYQPDSLAVASPVERQLPDVRVQHEFVQISTPAAAAPLAAPGRAAGLTARYTASAEADAPALEGSARTGFSLAPQRAAEPASFRKPAAGHASRDRSLFEKARRALIGDGRNRPEPFPRVR